jgi:molecular chaperone DnaK (HSP70)
MCFGCALQLKLEIRPKARAAVTKVLLVGGATRMPAVKRFLQNMTGVVSQPGSMPAVV